MWARAALAVLIVVVVSIVTPSHKGWHMRGYAHGISSIVNLPVQFSVGQPSPHKQFCCILRPRSRTDLIGFKVTANCNGTRRAGPGNLHRAISGVSA